MHVDLELLAALEALIEPGTRGDPESALRCTCMSTQRLAEELTERRHYVEARTVASLLRQAGYSLQANRKPREGSYHPDCYVQFEYVNAQVKRRLRGGHPAISADTKKKELVSDSKNAGRECRLRGQPQEVRIHDFQGAPQGKAVPYGLYDVLNNQGWVSVEIDHDTAQFASNAVRCSWSEMGRRRFLKARSLLVTADGRDSNSSRYRLWKTSLQELADELGLKTTVCHFPSGTSKWKKIEHRLFSFIMQNWRGQALASQQSIVSLIASTTTKTGLVVKAALDTTPYDKGIEVTDEELAIVRFAQHRFHRDWNYSILPK